MKGRYSGRPMTIYATLLPGARAIANSSALTDKLTEQAKQRIKILDWHKAHGKNASLTARHFGIGRMTLFRWLKRVEKFGLLGLNESSRKPKRCRTPVTPWPVIARIVELRKQYPAWSKHKLAAILKREGMDISPSTVGRILKRKGLIDKRTSARRRKSALSPKNRFPRGLRIHYEGQLIQIDTKYIMLVGGRKFYQFTAIDVLNKRRVLRVYSSQSSRNGALFLKECLVSFPYPIVALQTDNGAPFLKEFEKFVDIAMYFALVGFLSISPYSFWIICQNLKPLIKKCCHPCCRCCFRMSSAALAGISVVSDESDGSVVPTIPPTIPPTISTVPTVPTVPAQTYEEVLRTMGNQATLP